jgi:hypothetical protein
MNVIARRLWLARQVWISLVVSVLLFLLWQILTQGPPRPAFHVTMAIGLAPVALAVAVLSVLLPARVLRLALREQSIPVTDQRGESIGTFQESAPMLHVIADPEGAVLGAWPRYQSALIIGMALAEAVALFGLLLAYLGAPLAVWTPFFVVCFALMATKFPRLETLTRAIERATGATCKLATPGTSYVGPGR